MKSDKNNKDNLSALRIVAVYVVLCAVWSFLSDDLALYLGWNATGVILDSISIAVTSVILYCLLISCLNKHRLMEEKHRRNEARLELALAASKIGVWEWDLQTNAVLWSPECHDIVGLKDFNGTFEKFAELLHPDDAVRVMETVESALAQKSDYTDEFRIIRPDGELRWLFNLGQAIYDSNGNPVQLIGTVRDITVRKRVEESLCESEERYRAVVKDQTETITRYRPDGTYTFVNEVYCRLFGKTDAELLGHSWHPDVFPEDLPLIEKDLQRMSPEHPVVVVENRIRSATGEVLWMQFVNRGFYDQAGQLIETQAVGRDITELKMAEDALREANELLESRVRERTGELEQSNQALKEEVQERKEAEERLKGVALFPEENSSPVLRVSSESELLYANRAAAGLSNHCFCPVGEHVPDFIRHEVDAALASGERRELEIVCEEEIFLAILAPIPERKYVNFYCINITERKRVEQELINYQEQLEKIVCNRTAELESRNAQLDAEVKQRKQVEHDLREYTRRLIDLEEDLRKKLAADLHDEIGRDLTALGLNIAMLHDNLPAEVREKVAVRLDDSRTMLEAISRSVRGLMSELRPPVLDDYGLPAALRWHCDLFSKRSGLDIDLSMGDDFPRLSTDREMALFRIAQESLTNISKHAKANIVKVTLIEDGTMIRLSICDDGVGFHTSQAFPRQEGSCWGLTVMRERAEAAGGEFHLESAPGSGTCVLVEMKRS